MIQAKTTLHDADGNYIPGTTVVLTGDSAAQLNNILRLQLVLRDVIHPEAKMIASRYDNHKFVRSITL